MIHCLCVTLRESHPLTVAACTSAESYNSFICKADSKCAKQNKNITNKVADSVNAHLKKIGADQGTLMQIAFKILQHKELQVDGRRYHGVQEIALEHFSRYLRTSSTPSGALDWVSLTHVLDWLF